MATVDNAGTKTVGGPTYGNWSRPASPGLWKLGLAGTAWLFGGTIAVIFVALFSFPGALGLLVFVLLTLVPLIQLDRWGRNAYLRLWEHAQWVWHRRTGRHIYLGGPLSVSPTTMSNLPGLAAQVSVSESIDSHNRPFVVVHQPAVGHVSTVLELSPPGDGLVDPHQVDQQVAAYGHWLASLGHEDGLVGASVSIDTSPDTGVRLEEAINSRIQPGSPQLAVDTMREISQTFPAGSAETNYRMTLTWMYNRHSRGQRQLLDLVDEIATRLPDLTTGLANTGAGAVKPMTEQQLARAVRIAFDPSSAKALEESADLTLSWDELGPVHSEERKGHYLHDDTSSVSWFMGLAPRGTIRSSVLRRIMEPHREVAKKRVTLLYRPYDPARSATLVEDDVTNAHFLANQTHRPKARVAQNLRAVEQAAAEEALGAGLVRFAMIVTATVNEENLERATSVVEHSGTASRVLLRRAWRSQATAFMAGLPLGLIVPAHLRLPGDWRENV